MILYHYTNKENIKSILLEGLKPNRTGIVYLAPDVEKLRGFGDAILEVETGDLKLTNFEDCGDWEILCWGKIAPHHITVI